MWCVYSCGPSSVLNKMSVEKLISQQSVKEAGLAPFSSLDCLLLFLWLFKWIIFLFHRRNLFCGTVLLYKRDLLTAADC